MATEKATFAAGCFWGVEAAFMHVEGVESTSVGYTGGKTDNPTYEQVCAEKTGHAEAIEIDFDPNVITFEELLDIFWEIHNPTTLNRQGPDVGSQYRSAIFCHSPEQKEFALAARDALNASGEFDKPVVTQIEDAGPYYRAEEYHQRYVEKNPNAACAIRQS